MNAENQRKLQEVYSVYNDVFKPALAQAEVLHQAHPLPIFNEIRSFNDHIARCYLKGVKDEYISEQLSKAMGHIERGTFDCYKFSVYAHNKRLEEFEEKYKRVDLTLINNGKFYITYSCLAAEARKLLIESKKIESHDKAASFIKYQDAEGKYEELVEYMFSNLTDVNWARTKARAKLILRIIAFILLACLSGVISHMIGLVPWVNVIKLLGIQ